MLLFGVFVAGVVLAGWLALDVADRADAQAAVRQVDMIRGVVGEFGGVSLGRSELERQARRFGIGLAALAADGRVLAHAWPPGTAVALDATIPPGTVRPVAVAGTRYWLGLVPVQASPIIEPAPRGAPERTVGTPSWLAVCVPDAAASLAPVLGVAVGGGALLCGLVWLLLLPTVRRIGRLAVAARAASGGDLDRDVPVAGADEIGVLAGAFRDMLAGLRDSRAKLVQAERLAALGQIATAVAHEIRNPLAAIRLTVQLMGEEAHDTRLREDCDMLMREAARLELFLDDLLAFARPDPGVREPVDLAGVVADVCDLEQARADHLGVALTRAVAPELPRVLGDRRRLVQVCANLMLNAIQAAGPGGRVEVRAAAESPGVALAVTDTGPGVPPEVADRLFTPFVTSKPNGTGLGLALSSRIAREHGGDLVYRREGDRTVFALTLPAPARVAAAVTA